jgi:predicted GIY-YIG superfamily endonuclease
MQYFYVYILESISNPEHYYIGCTEDLKERLAKHNEGGCTHTKKFRPWRIKNYFAFDNKSKASDFERYLKSGSGREFTLRHF